MTHLRNHRIIFVTQFLPRPGAPHQTGGTISNLNFLRALAKEYSVVVLSFDNASSEADFRNEQFSVVSRPAPRWRAPQMALYWLDFVREETKKELSKATEEEKTYLIATTSTLSAFDVCGSDTIKIAIVRAYENFGFLCPWVPPRERFVLGKLAAIRKFQDPRFIRMADHVLTNSCFMQSVISSRFGISGERIQILPQACGISPVVEPAPEGTVGFVTRGAPKGLSFVLELADQSLDLQYMIYGDERDMCKPMPPNVDWRGWESDRSAMFASAALWLVPSRWAEPFGRVSIEAQAANRTVLVATSGGLPETVLDARFRIDGFDSIRWLVRIRELLKLSPDDVKSNGSAIRTKFSQNRHDSSILSLFASISNVRRRPTDA